MRYAPDSSRVLLPFPWLHGLNLATLLSLSEGKSAPVFEASRSRSSSGAPPWGVGVRST